MNPVIVWFRRDLRVDDHPALHHAAQLGRPVVPLFIFDTDLIGRLPSDGAAFNFQAECLADLQRSIQNLGGTMVFRHGPPVDVHRKLIEEFSPSLLCFNRDYHPAALERDGAVTALWNEHGLEVQSFPDVVQHEPQSVLTDQGTPYVVFGPYARKWKSRKRSGPLPTPDPITTPPTDPGVILDAKGLSRKVTIPEPVVQGGETGARKSWRRFRTGTIEHYGTDRDFPGTDGTSRLSPYLRFGCISIRRMIDDLGESLESKETIRRTSAGRFLDELIWREFYMAVLYHFPNLRTSNYRKAFNRFPWRFDEEEFNRWKEGQTGYPIVDAGMRQLNRTGWMHNRVRMIVASFLTKDLRHDWKLGEAVFEEKLLDIETASNNGGWQWAASTGVDPRPLRIFNPELQARRFDPEGTYIRSFVPELRNVPHRYLYSPSGMSVATQSEVGCIIGRDYPEPIVDHRNAARSYKTLFAATKAGGEE